MVVARGTLSITTTEIYFEVDEEESTFKNTDAKVRTFIVRTGKLHKWVFSLLLGS